MNLKVFQGAEYFNHYAESLRSLGAPVFSHLHLLTLLRIVVTGAVGLHVWAAVSLYNAARTARPQSYEMKKIVAANYASITMRYGGVVISTARALAFNGLENAGHFVPIQVSGQLLPRIHENGVVATNKRLPGPSVGATDTPKMVCIENNHFLARIGGRVVLIIF